MSALLPQGQGRERPVVSFPLPARICRRLACLASLLPHRWRRRVVIGGISFWQPE